MPGGHDTIEACVECPLRPLPRKVVMLKPAVVLVPVLFWLALVEVAVSVARAGGDVEMPKVGDVAPPILVETVYAPEDSFPVAADFTWDELAGKVVVLEFTASWCGPCLAALPHLNELALAFRDEPVVFLSLSSESDATCRKLQLEHRFETIFCRDADGSVFHDYWVFGIPHLVIIDPHGRIAAITHPREVEAKHNRAGVDGELVG